MRFVWHGVERQHDPRDLVNPCLGGGTFEQASTEHVVERPVTPLINGIVFGMVGRSEHSLDPEGAQQLAPYLTHKLSSLVREEPALRAEVGDHMPKEGLTHRVCCVVARWDEREQPAERQLMLLWKRRRSPRQVQLVLEEEDEVRGDLLVDTQEEDEESQELAWALEDRGQ